MVVDSAPERRTKAPLRDSVQRFVSNDGRVVYGISLELFEDPHGGGGFYGNVYLVDDGDRLVLVDCGSGLPSARRDLKAGLELVRQRWGKAWTLRDIDAILVTHGHIDHFGGLPWLKEETGAPAGVHILDRRVLSNYEERVVIASRHLQNFLHLAGVPEPQLSKMMELYKVAKGRYRSTPVDFLLDEGLHDDGPVRGFEVIHVPGHCPGMVCLRVDDLLLTADQVLAHTTPHQAPEAITQYMGLGHYLESLRKLERIEGIRLGLGGHEDPIEDFYDRLRRIRQDHMLRLQRVVEICREPKTIREISKDLFGERQSYHIFLALEETGAHVEYLYQRGELVAANYEEVETRDNAVIQYVAG